MKLIVDANVLFSFFKKDSFTRRFISKKELLEYVTVVPLDEFKDFWDEVKQISPDPDDVEYLAVALSLGCAIWSNDRDLKETQSVVKVFSTSDLISFLP